MALSWELAPAWVGPVLHADPAQTSRRQIVCMIKLHASYARFVLYTDPAQRLATAGQDPEDLPGFSIVGRIISVGRMVHSQAVGAGLRL